eukprot:CAMPEP_0198153040 /NCGR_PEP_ID=MMETSP1443-20131203/62354_1 /TAXON_ID=186043 /ORGANISM="Entomoneis sp., Strain CCMP2396" /LENGTH=254 /DNA_ID=CAMNT_0043819229 /DNA_START=231 /DNA_END=992 /DNA_ORIENTATION=+
MATTTMPTLPNIIVIAPTFYANSNNIRFAIGLETCREAARLGIDLILVDASPSEEIRDKLRAAGIAKDGSNKSYVEVLKQTYEGKKGAALREAVVAASQKVAAVAAESDTIVCFQEPEKPDMMRHWKKIVAHMVQTGADIGVPRRSDASFQALYPKEQYHSEMYGNLYLDSLAKAVDFGPSSSVDWLMGPIAWRNKYSPCWAEYKDGDLWDAQLCPMVHAQRWHNAKVTSYEITYQHPAAMKEEEEGSPKWTEK